MSQNSSGEENTFLHQQSANLPNDSTDYSFALAEYNALREEILKRIEIRYQLLVLNLTGAGVIFTFALQQGSLIILLLYPLLSFCLAMIWTSNNYQIWIISDYLIYYIEKDSSKNQNHWERYRIGIKENRGGNKILNAIHENQYPHEKLVSLASRYSFIGTEIVSLFLAGYVLSSTPFSKLSITSPLTMILGVIIPFFASLIAIIFNTFLTLIRRTSV